MKETVKGRETGREKERTKDEREEELLIEYVP